MKRVEFGDSPNITAYVVCKICIFMKENIGVMHVFFDKNCLDIYSVNGNVPKSITDLQTFYFNIIES